MIPGCLGFEIVRIYPQTGEERSLASWVPFKGQRNPRWIPQDTGVWPVQKTFWRDLTLRRRRDSLRIRPYGEQVAYRVRPVGDMKGPRPGAGAGQVIDDKPAYTGDARPLGYLGAGAESNTLILGSDVRQGAGRLHQRRAVDAVDVACAARAPASRWGHRDDQGELRRRTSKIRAYLHGEVPDVLTSLFDSGEGGGRERAARPLRTRR